MPEARLAAQRAHVAVERRRQAEVFRVALEVGDHLVARGVARIRARHGQARQARMPAIGVQVQAVVVAAPDGTDVPGFFQQQRGEAATGELRGTDKAGRARAHHDGIRVAHAASGRFHRKRMPGRLAREPCLGCCGSAGREGYQIRSSGTGNWR
jgi:hypothetical protein